MVALVPHSKLQAIHKIYSIVWCLAWYMVGNAYMSNFIDSLFSFLSLFLTLSRRYASLYFCCAIEQNDNELLTLEIIHRYVELLDKYFGSVSISLFFLSLSQLNMRADYLYQIEHY